MIDSSIFQKLGLPQFSNPLDAIGWLVAFTFTYSWIIPVGIAAYLFYQAVRNRWEEHEL